MSTGIKVSEISINRHHRQEMLPVLGKYSLFQQSSGSIFLKDINGIIIDIVNKTQNDIDSGLKSYQKKMCFCSLERVCVCVCVCVRDSSWSDFGSWLWLNLFEWQLMFSWIFQASQILLHLTHKTIAHRTRVVTNHYF